MKKHEPREAFYILHGKNLTLRAVQFSREVFNWYNWLSGSPLEPFDPLAVLETDFIFHFPNEINLYFFSETFQFHRVHYSCQILPNIVFWSGRDNIIFNSPFLCFMFNYSCCPGFHPREVCFFYKSPGFPWFFPE